jgi:1-acyl-sn-glycerol-3-phosphate acyltransferase
MAALRSLLFALIFYPGTVLFVLLAAVAALAGAAAVRPVANGWGRFHHDCARFILGIRTRVEGKLPPGPILLASKHQSMFETIEVMQLVSDPAVVMKQELAWIPLWGWLARLYGMIPIDREGGAAALRRMVREAARASADGRTIVIFPEGTRVAPGETPPLQPGFAGIYRALGLPVVPLALDSGRVWPRRSFGKRPGIITFRFGEPVAPGLPRSEAEALVHAGINALERA